MKLAIERSGGFDIIESADVERIEVENHGVRIYMTDGTDTFAERAGHAESVATAAAIAAKCGALVEALAESEDDKRERESLEGLGELPRRPASQRPAPKPATEWVDGEPPRDGRWYVARTGAGLIVVVRWHDGRWRDATGDMLVFWKAHLPTPIPER